MDRETSAKYEHLDRIHDDTDICSKCSKKSHEVNAARNTRRAYEAWVKDELPQKTVDILYECFIDEKYFLCGDCFNAELDERGIKLCSMEHVIVSRMFELGLPFTDIKMKLAKKFLLGG